MRGAGRKHSACEQIVAALLLTTLLAGLQGNACAQVLSPPLTPDSSSIKNLQTGDGDKQALPSQPIRVPQPSVHLSLPGSTAGTPDAVARGPNSSGWWLGSAGITLVLAVCGALCVAARKYWPQESVGALRIVGRVSLSSRHSIYLVRAGERVLLVGTGSQGAPSLLGELTDEVAMTRPAPGLDVRVGDDE